MNHKWDRRFIELAALVGGWSRDPSTQVGAVVAQGRRVVSVGFNGFPAGLDDHPSLYRDRDVKYSRTIHAEPNAVLTGGEAVRGGTIYTYPFGPCSACALLVIQSGIRRVVTVRDETERNTRWRESQELALRLFEEAGVDVRTIDPTRYDPGAHAEDLLATMVARRPMWVSYPTHFLKHPDRWSCDVSEPNKEDR